MTDIAHDNHHDEEVYSKTIFGFWIYLLTDFMLFATIFAAYLVVDKGFYGAATGKELFCLPYTLIQTFVLLLSSFVVGLASVCMQRQHKAATVFLFILTFLLGIVFMGMEQMEFHRFIASGNSWTKSAFLSGYFTVVGTHGIHMLFALLWVIVLLPPLIRHGFTATNTRRLTCLKMFWQFLNVVWIFIFTVVYLKGAS